MKIDKNNPMLIFFIVLPLCAIIVAAIANNYLIKPLLINDKPSTSSQISPIDTNNTTNNTSSSNTTSNSTNQNSNSNSSQINTSLSQKQRISFQIGGGTVSLVQFGVFGSSTNAGEYQRQLLTSGVGSHVFKDDDKYKVISELIFDEEVREDVKSKIASKGVELYTPVLNFNPIQVTIEDANVLTQEMVQSIGQCTPLIKELANVIYQYKHDMIDLQQLNNKYNDIKFNLAKIISHLSTHPQISELKLLEILQEFVDLTNISVTKNNIDDIQRKYIEVFNKLWNY